MLFSAPALILLLRGVNAFDLVRHYLANISLDDVIHHLDSRENYYIMSRDTKETYTLATIFFHNDNLFADNSMRHLYKYLPPPTNHINSVNKK